MKSEEKLTMLIKYHHNELKEITLRQSSLSMVVLYQECIYHEPNRKFTQYEMTFNEKKARLKRKINHWFNLLNNVAQMNSLNKANLLKREAQKTVLKYYKYYIFRKMVLKTCPKEVKTECRDLLEKALVNYNTAKSNLVMVQELYEKEMSK